MQYNRNGKLSSETIHLSRLQNNFVQEVNSPLIAKGNPNTAAVTKLTFKDKLGLVFVVIVLLVLQLMEKIKIIR